MDYGLLLAKDIAQPQIEANCPTGWETVECDSAIRNPRQRQAQITNSRFFHAMVVFHLAVSFAPVVKDGLTYA